MNDWLVTWGIESWKPVIGALLLPPAPLVLMVLLGGLVLPRRRRIGWTLLLAGALGTWLMCTVVAGEALTHLLLGPPRSLGTSEIERLKHAPKAAVVVLGGGANRHAPEYGMPTLTTTGIERLRYGVWLARRTALPLAFSGGVGHGAEPVASEAEIATRVAALEFGQPLRYTEARSRDTNENARLTLPLLNDQGIEHIVLVTHGYHMPRALAAFERAAQHAHIRMKVTPAPLGVAGTYEMRAQDWLPSRGGFDTVNKVLHEWIGRIGGA